MKNDMSSLFLLEIESARKFLRIPLNLEICCTVSRFAIDAPFKKLPRCPYSLQFPQGSRKKVFFLCGKALTWKIKKMLNRSKLGLFQNSVLSSLDFGSSAVLHFFLSLISEFYLRKEKNLLTYKMSIFSTRSLEACGG